MNPPPATPPTEPPQGGAVDLVITFLYYRDLWGAVRFYEDVLGLRLTIDQGWCRIYRIAGQACVGLVDEARGMQRANRVKPVQLCLRVPDVDAWHDHLHAHGAAALSDLRSNAELGIRAFTCKDPEGYQIEVQSVLPPG